MICPLEVPILVRVGIVPRLYPQEPMSPSSCALDHLSGRWSGYWYLRPDEFPEVVELAFHHGKVLGLGRDADGDFQYSGDYDTRGTIALRKIYTSLNRGDVIPRRIYVGGWDGRRLSGGWSDERTIRNAGGFHLWPGRGAEPRYLDPDPDFTWEVLLEAVGWMEEA